MSGRKVALRIYVEHGKEDRCGYAMDSLKRSMRWDEEAFGREYDLDIFMIVAVSDFNMGAMENKGLNVFNDKYVLAQLRDRDRRRFCRHRGDHRARIFPQLDRQPHHLPRLVPALPEGRPDGFPRSGIHRRSALAPGEAHRRRARLCARHQFVEDAGPLAHPVRPEIYHEINNFYTATVYEKGAEVVRMIKTLLGPDAFRKGMDLYFERHDGEAATVEQFVQCFADASGRDLSQFMRWYSQAGTPEVIGERAVRCREQDLPARPRADAAADARPADQGADGDPARARAGRRATDAICRSTRTAARASSAASIDPDQRRRRRSSSPASPNAPVLSLNRGFSAPVKLVANLSAADLRYLAAHDTDPFNRWQAVQTLATRLLLANVAALRAGKNASSDNGLIDALAAILADKTLEPAFVALALTLPSEADIAREIGKRRRSRRDLRARARICARRSATRLRPRARGDL